MSTVY
jgi:hypothetical protein